MGALILLMVYAGLNWVGMHGNAVVRPAIFAIWHSQALKGAFSV